MPMIQGGLLRDPPAHGAWNLAVDQVLLESATPDACVLRLYGWSRPTLSLGYFQPAGQRDHHPPSRACPMVRRSSGGGAIVHHHEWTYALVLGRHLLAPLGRPDDLYLRVHGALIQRLQEWGVHGQLVGPEDSAEPHAFLCFQRRAVGDVIIGRHKVAGSAQRRSRHAVLQHGSVLLASSQFAPELPGIIESSGVEVPPAELIEGWITRLGDQLGCRWRPMELTQAHRQRCRQLVQVRYHHPRWTRRR